MRLQDIHQLFAGHRGQPLPAGRVMAQGHIDQILSSKPEERRAVFEEAAGAAHQYKSPASGPPWASLPLPTKISREWAAGRGGRGSARSSRQIGSLKRQAAKGHAVPRGWPIGCRHSGHWPWNSFQHGKLAEALSASSRERLQVCVPRQKLEGPPWRGQRSGLEARKMDRSRLQPAWVRGRSARPSST